MTEACTFTITTALEENLRRYRYCVYRAELTLDGYPSPILLLTSSIRHPLKVSENLVRTAAFTSRLALTVSEPIQFIEGTSPTVRTEYYSGIPSQVVPCADPPFESSYGGIAKEVLSTLNWRMETREQWNLYFRAVKIMLPPNQFSRFNGIVRAYCANQ